MGRVFFLQHIPESAVEYEIQYAFLFVKKLFCFLSSNYFFFRALLLVFVMIFLTVFQSSKINSSC